MGFSVSPAAAEGGALIELATATPAGAAVSFASVFDQTKYRAYIIEFAVSAIPAAGMFQMKINTDATAGNYTNVIGVLTTEGGNAAVSTASAASGLQFNIDGHGSAAAYVKGRFYISDVASQFHGVEFESCGVHGTTTHLDSQRLAGWWLSNVALSQIDIAGNLTGKFAIYGVSI